MNAFRKEIKCFLRNFYHVNHARINIIRTYRESLKLTIRCVPLISRRAISGRALLTTLIAFSKAERRQVSPAIPVHNILSCNYSNNFIPWLRRGKNSSATVSFLCSTSYIWNGEVWQFRSWVNIFLKLTTIKGIKNYFFLQKMQMTKAQLYQSSYYQSACCHLLSP